MDGDQFKSTPIPSPSPTVIPEVKSATKAIQARGSWQAIGLKVKKGDKILIKSTGTWSGGQVDMNGNIEFVDAEGGNGYVRDASNPSQFVVGSGFDFDCGIQEPAWSPAMYAGLCTDRAGVPNTIVNAACQPPPIPGPNAIRIPDNNRGVCCSEKRRTWSYLLGLPYQVVEPNECLPIDKNILIMKIIPKFSNVQTFARVTVLRPSQGNCWNNDGPNTSHCNSINPDLTHVNYNVNATTGAIGLPRLTEGQKFIARAKYRAPVGVKARMVFLAGPHNAPAAIYASISNSDLEGTGEWKEVTSDILTLSRTGPNNTLRNLLELRLTTHSEPAAGATSSAALPYVDWSDVAIYEVDANGNQISDNLIRNPNFGADLLYWRRLQSLTGFDQNKNVSLEVMSEDYGGTPYRIGKSYERIPFTVEKDGELFFRNNDLDLGVYDNRGALEVSVEKVN